MDDELGAVAELARNFFAKEVTPHQRRFGYHWGIPKATSVE